MKFQCLNSPLHQPVQRFDLGAGGALHGPDVLHNQLRGHISDGDYAVDHPLAAHQLHPGAAVDLRHHLAPGLLPGCAHGHEDIGLVNAGQGHKGIGIVNALLCQQLPVRTVTHNDQRPGQ